MHIHKTLATNSRVRAAVISYSEHSINQFVPIDCFLDLSLFVSFYGPFSSFNLQSRIHRRELPSAQAVGYIYSFFWQYLTATAPSPSSFPNRAHYIICSTQVSPAPNTSLPPTYIISRARQIRHIPTHHRTHIQIILSNIMAPSECTCTTTCSYAS